MRALAAVVLLLLGGAVAALAEPLDVPLYQQQKNGCGAASLGMLLGYWAGVDPSLEVESPAALYRRLHIESAGGVRLAAMKEYLRERGFHAFTIRATWAELAGHVEKQRPVLVALRHGSHPVLHYAVVTGVSGERVWLNDPAHKRPQRVKRKKFEKQWDSAERWMLIATPK